MMRFSLAMALCAISQYPAYAVYNNVGGPPNVSVSPTATKSGSVPAGANYVISEEDAPAEVVKTGTATWTWTGGELPPSVTINAQYNFSTTTNNISASSGSAAWTELWLTAPTSAHSKKTQDPTGRIYGDPDINFNYTAPPVTKGATRTVTHNVEVRGRAKAAVNVLAGGSASATMTGSFSLTSINLTQNLQ